MKRIIITIVLLVIVIANFYDSEMLENFNFREFSLYFLSGGLLVSLMYSIANQRKSNTP